MDFGFSLGGESLAVAQNTYAVSWFKNKELNMVFGLQLSFSRVVSTCKALGPRGGGGWGGALHHIFGTRVQHTQIKWTQSDLSFCKNEWSKKINGKGGQLDRK